MHGSGFLVGTLFCCCCCFCFVLFFIFFIIKLENEEVKNAIPICFIPKAGDINSLGLLVVVVFFFFFFFSNFIFQKKIFI